MYESFFNLKERPFTLRPDPTFLYLSPEHALALTKLEYGLTGQTGFVVVTGEVGSGKTTLIRRFLKLVGRNTTVGVISNTHAAFGDILEWVFQALGIETDATTSAARYLAFTNYLLEQYEAQRQVVLIVDEAQNLSIGALEELRLLSNVNADSEEIIQIILAGQPELLEKLQHPELRQFAQRVSLHHHLLPLSCTETSRYILHRLSIAGASNEIFDVLAMSAIYYFTDGVPRLINSICDMALVYGFAQGKRIIDVNIVLSVVQDREQGGLHSLAKRAADVKHEVLVDYASKIYQHNMTNAADLKGGAFDQVAVSAEMTLEDDVNSMPLLTCSRPFEDKIAPTLRREAISSNGALKYPFVI